MLASTTDAEALKEQMGLFSLCINQQPQGHYHCGCLYQNEEGAIFFLHLAWDYQLISQDLPNNYFWVYVDMPASIKKFLAGLCSAITAAQPGVPYGLDPSGIFFNNDGSVTITHGTGLTCATFVLTLLKSYGLALLDEATWPENNRNSEQNKIVTGLRFHGKKSPELIKEDKNLIGSRFFTPEEVVAASTLKFDTWPVNYDTVSPIEYDLRKEIERAKAA